MTINTYVSYPLIRQSPSLPSSLRPSISVLPSTYVHPSHHLLNKHKGVSRFITYGFISLSLSLSLSLSRLPTIIRPLTACLSFSYCCFVYECMCVNLCLCVCVSGAHKGICVHNIDFCRVNICISFLLLS